MAFPAVQGTNTSQQTTAVTSHTVALPASIASGDLLIVIFVSAGTVSNAAGFSQLGDSATFYKIADGSEGASVTFTTGSAVASVHNSYRITGYVAPPQIGSLATDVLSSPDPPSLAPSWGSADTLWIAWAWILGFATPDITAAPTDYTNLIKSGTTDDNQILGSARRERAAASEDPATFSGSSILTWLANTVAIAPTGTVIPGGGIIGRGLTLSILLARPALVR